MQTRRFDQENFLATLTHEPGTYRMLDGNGGVLYVGKAGNLKKRVSAYFRKSGLSPKTRAMMEQVAGISITVTRSETEALLLESNLIKKHRPRYNVLLRDDKSYPYIYVSTKSDFPRITFHRGSRNAPGRYFGPYPGVSAVRETLNLMQKLFKLRPCTDSFFNNRTRPCLQYQIQRCSAPCVNLVDKDDYHANLNLALEFLDGNSRKVIEKLVGLMDQAAREQRYEDATRHRNQVAALRQVSEQQSVSGDGGDCDIIACSLDGGFACVQVFSVRGGLNIGNKAFHPSLPGTEIDESALLTAFAGQYYLTHQVPHEIIFSHVPGDRAILAGMLSGKAGHQVKLISAPRGRKRRCLSIACNNAGIALKARLASRAGMGRRLLALQEVLDLPAPPTRMECFDISHTMGERPVAACVVFDREGPVRQEYRHFNIENIAAGDDCAALHQAIERRYRRLQRGEAKLPDVLFIDGGKGQVNEAWKVLEELGVIGVEIVGVAKGEGRKPGLETLVRGGSGDTLKLEPESVALHLVQQIRDEAHRFAITGHRRQRGRARQRSPLEDIYGLGPERRRQLLKYFGGAQGINRASMEELGKVPGIGYKLATNIYKTLHGERPE